jgi:hypothetical protein
MVMEVGWLQVGAPAEANVSPADKRAALVVLGMAAAASPDAVKFQLGTLLDAGLGPAAQGDAQMLRAACVALKALAPAGGRALGTSALPEDSPAFVALRRVLVGDSLDHQVWFTVAEQVGAQPAGYPHTVLIDAV